MIKLVMIWCCITIIALSSACAAKGPEASGTTTVRANRAHPPRIGFEYYPELSKRAHDQGTCVVTLTVLADGTVKDVHITKSTGYPALDLASMSAFTTGTLLPATKNGVPIDDTIDLPVTWSIKRVD
jgi:periplasmic protein TonB